MIFTKLSFYNCVIIFHNSFKMAEYADCGKKAEEDRTTREEGEAAVNSTNAYNNELDGLLVSVYEVIPFLAKLVPNNLSCSFICETDFIVIASIDLSSLKEVFKRLVNNKISSFRMNSCRDGKFWLSIAGG